ncbi:SLATT domain-containing protein [Actinosynnema sp. NPDC023587]|uniref:SLATT domain-containing protein n=1 Tax=Actinosynnema sp. NPDC023587 TaxID=3154695 RepID=UPI0033F196F7
MKRIDRAAEYSRVRAARFRRRAIMLKVGLLMMSATATIILGWQDLDFWTGLAFSLVALTTVFAVLEPYFAWRSLWVLMEESLSRFHRLRDDVSHYLAATPADRVDVAKMNEMFDRYQAIWVQQDTRWGEFRRISDR